ncbi:MAG: hypothetical protein ACJ0DJ_09895 [bacterium]
MIDSAVGIVTGELGFQETHDGMNMNFGLNSGLRENALKFVLSGYGEAISGNAVSHCKCPASITAHRTQY